MKENYIKYKDIKCKGINVRRKLLDVYYYWCGFSGAEPLEVFLHLAKILKDYSLKILAHVALVYLQWEDMFRWRLAL